MKKGECTNMAEKKNMMRYEETDICDVKGDETKAI